MQIAAPLAVEAVRSLGRRRRRSPRRAPPALQLALLQLDVARLALRRAASAGGQEEMAQARALIRVTCRAVARMPAESDLGRLARGRLARRIRRLRAEVRERSAERDPERVLRETNRIGIEFLLREVTLAERLLALAARAPDPERSLRLRDDARRACRSVLRLLPRLSLQWEQEQRLLDRLGVVQAAIAVPEAGLQ